MHHVHHTKAQNKIYNTWHTWQRGQERIIYFLNVSCVLNVMMCPGTLGTFCSTTYACCYERSYWIQILDYDVTFIRQEVKTVTEFYTDRKSITCWLHISHHVGVLWREGHLSKILWTVAWPISRKELDFFSLNIHTLINKTNSTQCVNNNSLQDSSTCAVLNLSFYAWYFFLFLLLQYYCPLLSIL